MSNELWDEWASWRNETTEPIERSVLIRPVGGELDRAFISGRRWREQGRPLSQMCLMRQRPSNWSDAFISGWHWQDHYSASAPLPGYKQNRLKDRNAKKAMIRAAGKLRERLHDELAEQDYKSPQWESLVTQLRRLSLWAIPRWGRAWPPRDSDLYCHCITGRQWVTYP